MELRLAWFVLATVAAGCGAQAAVTAAPPASTEEAGAPPPSRARHDAGGDGPDAQGATSGADAADAAAAPDAAPATPRPPREFSVAVRSLGFGGFHVDVYADGRLEGRGDGEAPFGCTSNPLATKQVVELKRSLERCCAITLADRRGNVNYSSVDVSYPTRSCTHGFDQKTWNTDPKARACRQAVSAFVEATGCR